MIGDDPLLLLEAQRDLLARDLSIQNFDSQFTRSLGSQSATPLLPRI